MSPRRAPVGRANEGERELESWRLVADEVEEVYERSIRKHDDLVADGLLVGARVEDDASRLPAGAGIRSAREHGRTLETEADHVLGIEHGTHRQLQPIPDGIDEMRFAGIGGDRILVVEEPGIRVLDELDGVAPGQAAVGGLAHEHGVLAVAPRRTRRRLDVEGKAHEIEIAIGREGKPRVGRALEVATVVDGPARAEGDLRDHDVGPRRAGVKADPGHQASGSAARPPILLIAADDVPRIGRVHIDQRLDLAVEEQQAGLPGDVVCGTVGKRARAGHLRQRSGRERACPHGGEARRGHGDHAGDG